MPNAKEYVIWGIPKGETDEQILLACVKGEAIRDGAWAGRLASLLETKYGATKTRVQEVNMDGKLDWTGEISR